MDYLTPLPAFRYHVPQGGAAAAQGEYNQPRKYGIIRHHRPFGGRAAFSRSEGAPLRVTEFEGELEDAQATCQTLPPVNGRHMNEVMGARADLRLAENDMAIARTHHAPVSGELVQKCLRTRTWRGEADV